MICQNLFYPKTQLESQHFATIGGGPETKTMIMPSLIQEGKNEPATDQNSNTLNKPEDNDNNNNNLALKRHRVAFLDDLILCRVRYLEANDDLSPLALWYSSNELACIQARNWIALQSASVGCLPSTETLRGLERQCYDNYPKHCYHSLAAVLDEQDRQFVEGLDCPNLLARMYQVQGAYHARQEALERARMDALEASRCWRGSIGQQDLGRVRSAASISASSRRPSNNSSSKQSARDFCLSRELAELEGSLKKSNQSPRQHFQNEIILEQTPPSTSFFSTHSSFSQSQRSLPIEEQRRPATVFVKPAAHRVHEMDCSV